MKKATKVISTILMVIMIISIATTAFAETSYDPKDITGKSSTASVDKITTMGNSAVKIVTTIGMVASVIVLVVLGIKYMIGSAEEKAEYKKTLLPYVIGAVLVFAAATIASMVFQFASSI